MHLSDTRMQLGVSVCTLSLRNLLHFFTFLNVVSAILSISRADIVKRNKISRSNFAVFTITTVLAGIYMCLEQCRQCAVLVTC